MRVLFFLILVGLVFLSACVPNELSEGGLLLEEKKVISLEEKDEEESLCKLPYIEFKKGECCLDQDRDRVCDNDQVKTQVVEEKELIIKEASKVENVSLVLKEKGIEVLAIDDREDDVDYGHNVRVKIGAGGVTYDRDQVKTVFRTLYYFFGKEMDYFIVYTDNEKTRRSGSREVCIFVATYQELKWAVEKGEEKSEEWDRVLYVIDCSDP